MRRGKAESTPSRPAVATAEVQETILQDKAAAEEGATGGGLAWRALRTPGTLVRVERLLLEDYCSEEKMFGFHKPKMYRSIEGCCICRAKSSSSRFTDSKRYEKDFQSCFGLHETRSGDICNACVLLVKRWKKLPAGSKKNWNHVVDARAGPSLKTTLKPKKVKTLSGNRIKSNQISKLQKEFKRHNSDAHSTTSSASPAQSPCYSNQSDDGSDTEMASGSNRTPVFSFLDLTYWKRQKICCGIIYKGRFGEVLIDTHLFKPCCSNKKAAAEKPEEQGPEPLPISTQEW
ncbi:SIN3-HDAC complex-associated factor isoform X1 [Manis javanica]|uniref:SIN3-HDAC complex-associated factor isoform X1 n=1 Tax=Manis javanica TaxID=9974 RepID=UPI00187A743F|nr:SIN3-HDAC complex-associated factor isoform X2 [Manis javanica]KAI5945597.1 SIN3-HDAC complex-associated factor [Manis javanica]